RAVGMVADAMGRLIPPHRSGRGAPARRRLREATVTPLRSGARPCREHRGTDRCSAASPPDFRIYRTPFGASLACDGPRWAKVHLPEWRINRSRQTVSVKAAWRALARGMSASNRLRSAPLVRWATGETTAVRSPGEASRPGTPLAGPLAAVF